ncbi:putative response regulator [Aliivibrio wodanis]|uniref:diguanylate cyclase n=1 Tax=Aliivibrio wodanis TaxID=80852 RepID=A0A090INC5_9GAMM|nr:putative response regulator [Aliivibrio wodanis]VVV03376.1 Response regulator PleD [Aliivibrio wodanis]
MSSNNILIVEDSLTFRNYLHQQISNLGYEVISAESLAEARQILEKKTDFLCAVLDYCLPDGQDGEVIDLALDKQQRVIVLTAIFQDDLRERVLSKGVIDYILKESLVSISYLLPLIQRLTKNHQHKVLIVDDSSVVRKHIDQLLKQYYIQTLQAENGNQAIDILKENQDISLIITDHDMPEKDGISMIHEIRSDNSHSQLAILGISASDSKTLTARFLKAGANDFLYKPFHPEEFFCRIHQILQIKEANDALFIMANQDALTNLWNRRYLMEKANTGIKRRHIAMLDIDFFKKVNDTYGHDAGDITLVTVAHIMKVCFSDSLVARFGGEEFLIYSELPLSDFVIRLNKMRERLGNVSIPYHDQEITITISAGVSGIEGTLEEQIKDADEKLYQAKNSGRNKVISEI